MAENGKKVTVGAFSILDSVRCAADGVATRMKSQSVRQLAVLALVLATLFLYGCGQSEQAKEAERLQAIQNGLDTANRLLFSEQTDQALAQLESLDQAYPNNPEILEALAFAYAKKPDHALAAFYFDTVVQIDPTRSDLALYAARSHAETGDTASAARAYQTYLKDSPEDAAAWRALAKAQMAEQRTKPALDAWLEALRNSGDKPTPLEAAQLGTLYLKLDNLTQARRWLQAAADAPADGDSKQIALLGLVEVDLREQQWVTAEKRIVALDKVAPNALDNSPLASARLELKKWREAQAELEKQRIAIAQQEAEQKKEEEAARVAQTEAERKKEASITIDRTGQTVSLTDDTESLAPGLDKSLPTSGPPAHTEEERVAATEEAPTTNPNGTVAPTPLADDGSATSATTTTTTPITAEPSLTERADLAYQAGNYAEAIRLYQSALAEEPNAAPIYYGLSRSYYRQEQWPQSEMYASEAMRLSPNDLRYTVNYLRAIQRTQSSERLMAEMTRAKERFPDSPDVTLALARGYERLYNNRRNAIFLYQEFLTLAPAHPQAEDVRQHLQNLQ